MKIRFHGNANEGYRCEGYWPDAGQPRLLLSGATLPTIDDALDSFWDQCAIRLCEFEEIKSFVATQELLERRRDPAEPPPGFLGC